MANEVAIQYTVDEWRKFIAEILEYIEDPVYLYRIYSLVCCKWTQDSERRREECPKS